MSHKKIYTVYEVQSGNYTIDASISEESKITLQTDNETKEFTFINSKPEVVMAIGKCIQEAAKISITETILNKLKEK